ncbi:hypothetical protein ATO6_23630 [Oceanicola sp. 22II-s10i]|nr:hypothetical protein ATO6_23630 [Oceanicola sp. 22II-s10i]
MPPPKEIFYEDEDILIETCLFDTPSVVFSFSSFIREGEPYKAFGYPFLPREGFSAVYFTAKVGHWWQMRNMPDLVSAVEDRCAAYADRVTYGSSMGGYGALHFASPLGAQRAIAVVPQVHIADPHLSRRPEWDEELAKRQIFFDDISASLGSAPVELKLLYDPRFARDMYSARLLASFYPVQNYLAPFMGHRLLAALKEAGLLERVITGMLSGRLEPDEFRTMIRKVRSGDERYDRVLKRGLAQRRKRSETQLPRG